MTISQILWPDASLENIAIDYDAVTLRLAESTGRRTVLRCEGHIGFQVMGFWDEMIIERAELLAEHPGLDACLASMRRRVGATSNDTGNDARNDRRWSALLVHLIDGCVIEVYAARFLVVPA